MILIEKRFALNPYIYFTINISQSDDKETIYAIKL